MRDRALLLVLIGACLFSLLVAYWQHEAVQEAFRDVERLTKEKESKALRLQSTVMKNVELSEQITRLAEEAVQHRTAASEALKAKEALESALAHLETRVKEDGRGRSALEEKVMALEAAVGESTARLKDELEATRTQLKELRDLAAADEMKVLQRLGEVEKRLTPLTALPEKLEALGSLLRESAESQTGDARTLEDLSRVGRKIDEHQASLQSLHRKIEILGEMLAVDGRPFQVTATPPPRIEATVVAVDSARSEIAIAGDVGGLEPGHVVLILRGATAVGRAEVFRVDVATRLAAARLVWTAPGEVVSEGDRVTTERVGTPPAPAGSSEKEGEAPAKEEGPPLPAAGRESDPGTGLEPSEGPISTKESGPVETLGRPRPPPPPPRPDDGG